MTYIVIFLVQHTAKNILNLVEVVRCTWSQSLTLLWPLLELLGCM